MEDAVPDPHDELILYGELAFRADLDDVRHFGKFLFPARPDLFKYLVVITALCCTQNQERVRCGK